MWIVPTVPNRNINSVLPWGKTNCDVLARKFSTYFKTERMHYHNCLLRRWSGSENFLPCYIYFPKLSLPPSYVTNNCMYSSMSARLVIWVKTHIYSLSGAAKNKCEVEESVKWKKWICLRKTCDITTHAPVWEITAYTYSSYLYITLRCCKLNYRYPFWAINILCFWWPCILSYENIKYVNICEHFGIIACYTSYNTSVKVLSHVLLIFEGWDMYILDSCCRWWRERLCTYNPLK
jgi:hypothetical protein